MKAINLIPVEERRGAGGAAGRSGGLAYLTLVFVGGVAVLAVVYALAARNEKHAQAQQTSLNGQVALVQARSAAYAPYIKFQALAQQRETAVAQLATARFDWARAMQQIALALPSGVTLSALNGSTSSSTSSSSSTPTATGGPNFTFTGCAKNLDEVATTLDQLRALVGVSTVSLGQSSTGGGGGCGGATFEGVISFGAGYNVGVPLSSIQHTQAASAATAAGSASPTASTTAGAPSTTAPAPTSTAGTATTPAPTTSPSSSAAAPSTSSSGTPLAAATAPQAGQ
jgi:Tfp pilus assembly protein PilN